MNQAKITQDNVHLLLPNKVAQLADRLLQNGVADDMATALNMVYTSPVYAKLEQEKTKYWWLGVNALYQEITQSLQKSIILKHKHYEENIIRFDLRHSVCRMWQCTESGQYAGGGAGFEPISG